MILNRYFYKVKSLCILGFLGAQSRLQLSLRVFGTLAQEHGKVSGGGVAWAVMARTPGRRNLLPCPSTVNLQAVILQDIVHACDHPFGILFVENKRRFEFKNIVQGSVGAD